MSTIRLLFNVFDVLSTKLDSELVCHYWDEYLSA